MEKKICSKCRIEKSVNNFCKNKSRKDGLNCYCDDCAKIYRNNWTRNNKEKVAGYHNIYYRQRSDEVKQREKEYRVKNKKNRSLKSKEWNENHKEYRKEYGKRWRISHPEYRNKYEKERLMNDLFYKFIANIRGLIRKSFKRKGYNKSSHAYEMVGLSYDELKNYLFKNAKFRYPDFKEEDFLKSNKYHIDHIIPLSTAKTEKEVIKLCHYTNLQLLTAEDNLTKSNKIE
jgi:hypothetical protein